MRFAYPPYSRRSYPYNFNFGPLDCSIVKRLRLRRAGESPFVKSLRRNLRVHGFFPPVIE